MTAVQTQERTDGNAAWAAGLVVAAGLAVYAGSFAGTFVFDDLSTIRFNPAIRSFATAWHQPAGLGLTTNGRPLGAFSLALNYAISGTGVWSYHVFNVAIHLLAGLALFGVVRRTLAGDPGAGRNKYPKTRYAELPPVAIAFASALLWTVHPLQTESVTYIGQRVESMMGLFYLLTLYCFIRGVTGDCSFPAAEPGRRSPLPAGEKAARRRRWFWFGLSCLACLFGMLSKEVMVSAPLLVVLYDRTFVSGSFREAWRRHRGIFAGLAATWVPLACAVVLAGNRGGTAGYGANAVWWRYALVQFPAILHYLRLCFWPHPLVIDYGSSLALQPGLVVPGVMAVAALLAGVAVALARRPALGFLGAAFFAILAPSSSVVPIATETMAEHRMYLPLAPVVVLSVVVLYRGLQAVLAGGRRAAFALLAVASAAGCVLGIATVERNRDYSSDVALWTVTAQSRPGNMRAVISLAYSLQLAGRFEEAVRQYQIVVKIQPDYLTAQENLANCLARLGRIGEAAAQYETAAREHPDSAKIRYSLGNVLGQLGRRTEAADSYREALRLEPDFPEAHCNLGNVLAATPGRLNDAIAQYREALRQRPDYAEAHYHLGNAWYVAPGRLNDAVAEYREALRLRPDYAEAHYNLAAALLGAGGGVAEARAHLEAFLRLRPDNEAARQILTKLQASRP